MAGEARLKIVIDADGQGAHIELEKLGEGVKKTGKEVGLAKIPQMSKIEQSASYFYNTVGFQKLS